MKYILFTLLIFNIQPALASECSKAFAPSKHKEPSAVKQIIAAVKEGKTREAKDLISKTSININMKDKDGNTLLHLAAAQTQESQVAQLLLSLGADPTIKNKKDQTPIDLAKIHNHPALLTLFKRVSQARKELETATIQGDLNLLRQALEKGANNVNTVIDRSGRTALIVAIQSHSFESVKLLAENRADINTPTKSSGLFPIHYAVMENQVEIFKYLISLGVDFDKIPLNKVTPFHVAARYNRKEMAQELLIHAPQLLDIKNSHGHTPAQVAKLYKNKELFKLLSKNSSPFKKAMERLPVNRINEKFTHLIHWIKNEVRKANNR